eukprot:1490514-Alexandrium_andersonii.AAC.1
MGVRHALAGMGVGVSRERVGAGVWKEWTRNGTQADRAEDESTAELTELLFMDGRVSLSHSPCCNAEA